MDVDYEDLNLERAMSKVQSYDPLTQKFMKERSNSYAENMDKARLKLRQQNFKNKKPTNIEDKNFEVARDPLDGNIYLHIEPSELA